jgi:hypothetical protein
MLSFASANKIHLPSIARRIAEVSLERATIGLGLISAQEMGIISPEEREAFRVYLWGNWLQPCNEVELRFYNEMIRTLWRDTEHRAIFYLMIAEALESEASEVPFA